MNESTYSSDIITYMAEQYFDRLYNFKAKRNKAGLLQISTKVCNVCIVARTITKVGPTDCSKPCLAALSESFLSPLCVLPGLSLQCLAPFLLPHRDGPQPIAAHRRSRWRRRTDVSDGSDVSEASKHHKPVKPIKPLKSIIKPFIKPGSVL